jgi:cytochrome P450
MARTFSELVAYLKQITHERRRAPKDDLVSTIVAQQAGEAALDDYDVVNFVMLLLVAGNETTTNLIGNAVNALLDHPAELEKLARQPELVGPAIEEALRFDSPVQLIFRTATRDVEMHGVTIPKGATVVPLLGSANRDERQFPEPDRFDVERRPRSHLAFGFGHHFCLGSSLARLEARGALEVLVPELAGVRREAGALERLDSFLVRGPRRMGLRRAA